MDLHSTHSTPVKMRTGHRGSFDSLRSSSSSSTFSESETARERDGLEAATPKATNKSNHFNTNNNSKKTVFEATGTGTGLASPFWNRVFPWSNKSPIAKPAPLAASTITQVAADETIAETDKDTAENIEHARSVRRVKSALAFGNQERKPSEEDEQFEDERGRRHKHDGPLLSLSNNSAWARPRSRAQSVNSPAGSRLPIPASASTSFAPALALHPARPPSSTSSHTTNGFGKGVDSLTSASTSTSSNPTTSDFWNPPYQSSADPTTPTSDTKRGLLFSSSASSQAIFPKSAVDAFWKQHSSPLGSVSGGADGNMDAHSPASFMKEQFFSPRSSPSSSMCAKSTHIPDTESDLMVPALAPAAEKLEPSPNSSIEQQQRPQSSQPAQYTQKSSQQPPTEQAPRAPTRSSWPASSHVSPHALTPLHAYMTMSKTGTLDTLAPDALVALPDVSTDLLESDIAALEMLASGVPLPDSPISVQVVGASPRFRLDEALVVSPLRKGRGSPLARRASEGSLGGASRVGMPTVFGAAAPRYAPILVPQQQFQQQQQSGGEEVLVSLQSPVNGGLRGISSPRGVGMGGGWMSPQGGQVGVYRGGPAAPSAAMVELHSVFSTPGSVPRYSERDVQAIKRDMRLQVKFFIPMLRVRSESWLTQNGGKV
ncbi:hypothetical protein BC830DRAFT_144435 [Chytriomyces sp. MP71]|nr:hypothetical protein BC830DRAFT_144435 [Chytriomyces sp. MP71]